jgi:hypothetical protein
VAKSPTEALSAVTVQSPVWLASTVTVAVVTPLVVDTDPTVHRVVKDDVNVTGPPDVALAEIEKVCADDEVTLSLIAANEMLLASPTNTLGSMYMVAPRAIPPEASYDPLTNRKR